MNGLVEAAALSEEQRKNTNLIKIKHLLTKIYDNVISKETVEYKIGILIGDGDEGLVGVLIELLKGIKTADFDQRDKLLEKSEKFRDDLKALNIEPEDTVEEPKKEEEKEEEDEEDEDVEDDEVDLERDAMLYRFEFYDNVKKLFETIINLEKQITDKKIFIAGDSTTPAKRYFLGKHKVTPEEYYKYTNPKTKQTTIVRLISTEKELKIGNDGKYSKVVKLLKDGNVFVVSIKCLNCNGTGKSENKSCRVCKGNGRLDNDEKLKIAKNTGEVPQPFVTNYKNLEWVPKKKLSSTKPPVEIGASSLGAQKKEENPVKFWNDDFKLESYFYENEMLPTERRDFESFYFALFEDLQDSSDKMNIKPNVIKLKPEDKDKYKIWKEILKVYNSKDLNLKLLAAELKEIIKLSKVVPDPDEVEDYKYDEYNNSKVISIGKEIIRNEATLGKPYTFQELLLIKERIEAETVAKHISLLAKRLLALDDHREITRAYGKAGEYIEDFLERYDNLKELYPDLIEAEKAVKELKEKKKNEGRLNRLYNYSKFRMFEELEDELEEEEKKTEEDSKNVQAQGEDGVKKAWDNSFTIKESDGDKFSVKAFLLTKEEIEKQKQTFKEYDNSFKKEFNIDVQNNQTHKDYVVKIVNAFGRAYRLYATQYIPSGRPGGRVSLKTFREYKYIGKSDSRGGQWQENQTPGDGPWAAKLIFRAWEKRVEKMLEDNKYKPILQNAKFVYQGAVEGSGKTPEESRGDTSTRREIKVGRSLFDFINEMMNPEGEFEVSRKKVMKEWFGGVDPIKDDPNLEKPDGKNDNISALKSGGEGKEGEVSFFQIGHPNFKDSEYGTKAIEFFKKYKNCFFKIKYFKGKAEKTANYIIGYVYESKDNKIWIKYNKGDKGDKQNIISKYLSNQTDDLKSFGKNGGTKDDPNKDLFLGAIESNSTFSTKGKDMLKIKEANVSGNNKVDGVVDLEWELEEISILVKNKGKGELVKLELKNPKLLGRDIDTLSNVLSSYNTKK
jgi:hypothetical protein